MFNIRHLMKNQAAAGALVRDTARSMLQPSTLNASSKKLAAAQRDSFASAEEAAPRYTLAAAGLAAMTQPARARYLAKVPSETRADMAALLAWAETQPKDNEWAQVSVDRAIQEMAIRLNDQHERVGFDPLLDHAYRPAPLRLHAQGLTSLPAPLIKRCRSLSITAADPAILQNLDVLAGVEHLGIQDTDALPQDLGRLTQLKTLNISDSKIATLPRSIGYLKNLESLGLARTAVTEFPSSLRHLSSLKYMTICDHKVKRPGLGALPAGIGFDIR